MKETTYTYFFTVKGKGAFPLDMLRYDNCTPFTEGDSHAMQHEDGERTIRLAHRSPEHKAHVHRDRWASFGWTVVAVAEITP